MYTGHHSMLCTLLQCILTLEHAQQRRCGHGAGRRQRRPWGSRQRRAARRVQRKCLAWQLRLVLLQQLQHARRCARGGLRQRALAAAPSSKAQVDALRPGVCACAYALSCNSGQKQNM